VEGRETDARVGRPFGRTGVIGHRPQDVAPGRHVGLEQAVAARLFRVFGDRRLRVVVHVLRHRIQIVLQQGLPVRIRQSHAMNPALPAVRQENQPVDAVAGQELDFVALIEDADLSRAKLIR